MRLIVGIGTGGCVGDTMLNGKDALLPSGEITRTAIGPGIAVFAISSVAVICVGLFTFSLLTPTPSELIRTRDPAVKLPPSNIIGTLVPNSPPPGLIELRTSSRETLGRFVVDGADPSAPRDSPGSTTRFTFTVA
jgi:hypothetical protein